MRVRLVGRNSVLKYISKAKIYISAENSSNFVSSVTISNGPHRAERNICRAVVASTITNDTDSFLLHKMQ